MEVQNLLTPLHRPGFREMDGHIFVEMLYAVGGVGTPVLRPQSGPWKQPNLPRKRNPGLKLQYPPSLPIMQAGLFPPEAKSPTLGRRPVRSCSVGG